MFPATVLDLEALLRTTYDLYLDFNLPTQFVDGKVEVVSKLVNPGTNASNSRDGTLL